MTATPRPAQKYLRNRGMVGPWRLQGCSRGDFAAAVVIPALAEDESLPATLASLAANPPYLLDRVLTVVVVNHPGDADAATRAANARTLAALAAAPAIPPLAWVDAASPGLELPPLRAGVGLARKIGFDLALGRLDWQRSPWLAALDADTLVDPAYLAALAAHFATSRAGGAVVPFRHREEGPPALDAAIRHYELYLRHYVLGLSLAGSPYAFHTVGSAMACRAETYVRAGGMNLKTAGEDFYFLQQLAKTGAVRTVAGTEVRPSARLSNRTPFGTGPSLRRLLEEGEGALPFYDAAAFRLLAGWLELADRALGDPAETLLAGAAELGPALADWLGRESFAAAWTALAANHPRRENLRRAFHGWFDGLRTFRLIRHLSSALRPFCPAAEVLPPLLRWGGQPVPATAAEQLALLRRLQAGDDGFSLYRQGLA